MIPIILFASECLMINEFKLNQGIYDEKLLIEENVKLVVQFVEEKEEVFEFKGTRIKMKHFRVIKMKNYLNILKKMRNQKR